MPLFRRKQNNGVDPQYELMGGPRLQPGRANPLVEAPVAPLVSAAPASPLPAQSAPQAAPAQAAPQAAPAQAAPKAAEPLTTQPAPAATAAPAASVAATPVQPVFVYEPPVAAASAAAVVEPIFVEDEQVEASRSETSAPDSPSPAEQATIAEVLPATVAPQFEDGDVAPPPAADAPAPAADAPASAAAPVVIEAQAEAAPPPAAPVPIPAATEPPPPAARAAAPVSASNQALARKGLTAVNQRNGNGGDNGITPVVSIQNITKVYQMGDMEVAALRGINVVVNPGEMTAIMGPSGSGKSTLMNVIGCLDVPTSGTYLLDGTDVSKLSDDQLAEIRARKIGFVFQSFNLLSRTTALANVELPLIYLGAGARKRHGRAEESLKLVGLGDRLHHKPNELSGGQQQRVAIARALINDPAMILADEPTGNLDSKTSVEIMELFQRLNVERGMTILFVTHNIETADYCHRVIHVRDGVVERDVRHEPRAGIYRDLLPENMSIDDLRPIHVGDEEMSI